ncbi:MAG: DNA repair protein RadA, partial [Bacteroidales bacterium]
MAKSKSVYVCSSCGADSPKWLGKCPICGEWNSYVEEIISVKHTVSHNTLLPSENRQKPIRINDIIG